MNSINLWDKTSKKAGKVYPYFSLATNYTDKNGNRKKNEILRLGRLTKEEAAIWRMKLKILNSKNDEITLTDLNTIKYSDSKKYLDIAILSYLYDNLEFEKVFDYGELEVGTKEVAKILTLSRCLDPQAHYRTVHWFKDSYLPEMMNIDSDKYNKNKLFRELSNIHACKDKLQEHFVQLSKKFKDEDLEVYFFDATTSYFEGVYCDLADSAKDKTTGYQDKVILIFLVTDKQGLPICWDVFGGRAKESVEFKKIAMDMCRKLGINEVTFCFDRGIASVANFKLIEGDDLKSKFISGLNSDQIEKVFDLDGFVKNTREKLIEGFNLERENGKKVIRPVNGFYRLGKDRYYRDLGTIANRRHVVSFNVDIYRKMKTDRLDMIEIVKQELDKLNNDYALAKRDRDDIPLENKIKEVISKYKLQSVFNYEIIPIATKSKKPVETYKINYSINQKAIHELEKHDGILVYITNHTEKTDVHFQVSASQIVQHYKNKYLIENAFRHLKSFADLRPFNVRLEEHVKAHVDICMVAYFINTYIYNKLSPEGISLTHFYSTIKSFSRVCKLDTGTGQEVSLLKSLSGEVRKIIKILGASSVISKTRLDSLKLRVN
jgi:transposase